MTSSEKILLLASTALSRGQPILFKRLLSLGDRLARSDRTNTDVLLDKAIQEERKDEPPSEIIDGDGDGELVPPESDSEECAEESDESEAEDDDTEAFFPMGALGQNQRLQGPDPKDVVLSLGPKVFKNQ